MKPKRKDERGMMEKAIATVKGIKNVAGGLAEEGLKKIRDQVPNIKNRHGKIGDQLEGREPRTEKALERMSQGKDPNTKD